MHVHGQMTLSLVLSYRDHLSRRALGKHTAPTTSLLQLRPKRRGVHGVCSGCFLLHETGFQSQQLPMQMHICDVFRAPSGHALKLFLSLEMQHRAITRAASASRSTNAWFWRSTNVWAWGSRDLHASCVPVVEVVTLSCLT